MTSPTSKPETGRALRGNIYLVGLMGAGKTSVGRVLAKRLRKTFVDSDHEIESRTGVVAMRSGVSALAICQTWSPLFISMPVIRP